MGERGGQVRRARPAAAPHTCDTGCAGSAARSGVAGAAAMRGLIACSLLGTALPLLSGGCAVTMAATPEELACAKMLASGFRPVAAQRTQRFLGKVSADTARRRGGEKAGQ